MNYKKLLISALLTACGATSYAAAVNYNAGTSYSKGQEVNNAGSCYVCDIPGWCSSSAAWAYAPGTGTAWQQAWTEGCENPGPSPEPTTEKTISVKLSGDSLPADARIEFSANGKSYTVTNNQVTLPYSDSQTINYAVSATNGSISPNSFAMTKDSSSINLTYTKQPAPVPGKCDTIPADVKDFIPNGQGGFWGGYSKGAFVKFDGSIYQLLNDYWTSASPADSSAWVLCEAIVQAQVNIKTTGLPEIVDKVDVKIGSQTYTINPNNPTPITVAKGSYDVSVSSVLSSDGSKNYVAKTIIPNPVVVNEETTEINLNINFQAEDVKPANVSFNVKFPEDASPSKTVTAERISSNGDKYGDSINLDNGSNTTTIPSKGEFTIKPENYEINGTNYSANSITIVNGKVQSDNTISYEIAGAWPEKVIGGYTASWGADWNHKITSIDNMGENGYNIALLAFGKVINTDVGMFDDATICASGCTWDYDYTKKDAPLVIMSFGGIAHENTWTPDLSSDQSINKIAEDTVSFAAENHINGVDFDLEGASTGISDADVVLVDGIQTYPKITKLITAIREAANKQADKFPRGFFITAAPQTDGNDLYWAASGNKKFDSMLNADACGGHECFDSIFVQNYNSAKMNPNTAYDIVTRLLTAGNNTKTKFVMGYDLASGEWANNYPVIGWESETNGSDAPIVSATKFAKEHQDIGAFVWQAEQDKFGGASNKGVMTTGNDSYSFAHAMKEVYNIK